jgi:hypothetical protein
VELGKREIVWKHDARRAECFHTISSFPNSTSVDITIYQYGKNVLYIFYNIAMSKARRIRKFSVFTSGGKFPVLTLSYINTALSQSAFRIYKCYIIKLYINTINVLYLFIAQRNIKKGIFRRFRVDIELYQHGS